MTYEEYSTALSRRPLRLEVAEDIFDAFWIDASLSHQQRETLALLAFRRFYRDESDAVHACTLWLQTEPAP